MAIAGCRFRGAPALPAPFLPGYAARWSEDGGLVTPIGPLGELVVNNNNDDNNICICREPVALWSPESESSVVQAVTVVHALVEVYAARSSTLLLIASCETRAYRLAGCPCAPPESSHPSFRPPPRGGVWPLVKLCDHCIPSVKPFWFKKSRFTCTVSQWRASFICPSEGERRQRQGRPYGRPEARRGLGGGSQTS